METREEPKSRSSVQDKVGELWWYQSGLRLRHLGQVVGRNLQGHGSHPTPIPACPLPTAMPRPPPTHGYYYTLHVPSNNEEIYRSELQSTVNPIWQEMEQESINTINLRSLKGILVRLWFKPKGESENLVTSWGVQFSGLVPVGASLPPRQDHYQPNTLVFKLRNLFYTAADCYTSSENKSHQPILRHGFSLPLSETKRSYTVSALSRLHSIKRAQRQQEGRWCELREVLESRGVIRTSQSQLLAAQVEDCRVKVALLREQLEAEIDKLRAIKLSADNLDNQNQEKGIELLGGYQGLHRQLVKARGNHESDANQATAHRDACVCLGSWRRHLIDHLPAIYPITQDSKGKYHICGVHLPDAENFEGTNEVALSVGLGFVAHLLVLLSQLMHLPLRYPVRPHGSLATITDVTSLQLRDSEREFPLYTRGKERERLHFNYGVFLLNKNIAQMRWYCGIPTPDLRSTLPNLHFLMMKLTQNHNGGNQPLAIMPDVIIPISASNSIEKLEVHTPAILLQQRHAPRLPLNPLATSSTSHLIRDQTDNEDEDVRSPHWRPPGLSSSETNSSEASPVKDTLYVREAAPLHGGTTGKFVFVDKVKDPLTSSLEAEKHYMHSNGFSFSLDDGLNHIGGKNASCYKIKDLSSCDDLKLMNTVIKTTSYNRGSDPSLVPNTNKVTSEEGEEETLPVFKQQTTELLRSWHEDDPSHYTGALEICSSEKLEEVGVECDESFMCSSTNTKPEAKRMDSKQDSGVGSGTGEGCITPQESVTSKDSESVTSKDCVTPSDPVTPTQDSIPPDTQDSIADDEEKNTEESTKNGKDIVLSLSELGISEDMFLNDVAFRTAALAKSNCSFKMSFSRQSTEDEYH